MQYLQKGLNYIGVFTLVGPNYFWAEIVYSLTLMSGIIESFGKLSGNTQYLF